MLTLKSGAGILSEPKAQVETMPRRKVIRGEGETRRRILETAIRCFAGASYDEIGLRDIAADVGVDVAYVHRCFGSKENLFREVLRAVGETVSVSGIARDALPAALARRQFERRHAPRAGEIDPLLMLVRSLTSQKAGRLVGERLESQFIEPMRAGLDDPAGFRAAMIMSLLIGLSIMRNLLHLPAATEIDAAEAEALVVDAVEAIMRPADRGAP